MDSVFANGGEKRKKKKKRPLAYLKLIQTWDSENLFCKSIFQVPKF